MNPSGLEMWSILLAVASTTLAVSASIFSWISFRRSSEMQIQAEAILAKIAEKVEVVVERTSHQMDRAWDYFTRPPADSALDIKKEIAEKQEEMKKEIIEDARKQTAEAIASIGLDEGVVEALAEKMQDVIYNSTNRAIDVGKDAIIERAEEVMMKFAKLCPDTAAWEDVPVNC